MTVMHEPLEGQPPDGTARPSRVIRRRLSLAAAAAACLFFALTLLLGASASTAGHASMAEVSSAAADPPAAEPQTDFSRFTHTNPQHARLPCLLCHQRGDNSPRPVRSAGHTPCAGCHAQQFADQSSPICTICHTSPPTPALKGFPLLRSFNVRFDHATHTGASARSANCATCHRPSRRGVALSIPAGTSAHATCFQCHTPRAQGRAGQDISSCGACHRLGRHARTPETAAAYRVNFSHAAHTSKGLACAECHTVRAGASQRRQVTSPTPLMHHASPGARSCMTCHDNKRAFGGDDFDDCTRCHRGNAWHF